MLKPYPKDLNEQINRLSVMLDNSPAEAFLAIIHTINFLAQECNRLVSYDHELSWEAVRSAFSDQLFDVFSHEPPPVENGPAYQKTCAYLRRIFTQCETLNSVCRHRSRSPQHPVHTLCRGPIVLRPLLQRLLQEGHFLLTTSTTTFRSDGGG